MSHTEERTVAGLRVLIDRTLCVAFENCVDFAPDVFRLGPDGVITFVEATPDIPHDRLIQACKVCPVDALTVLGEDGETLAP